MLPEGGEKRYPAPEGNMMCDINRNRKPEGDEEKSQEFAQSRPSAYRAQTPPEHDQDGQSAGEPDKFLRRNVEIKNDTTYFRRPWRS